MSRAKKETETVVTLPLPPAKGFVKPTYLDSSSGKKYCPVHDIFFAATCWNCDVAEAKEKEKEGDKEPDEQEEEPEPEEKE
jgi:hypothetical protein